MLGGNPINPKIKSSYTNEIGIDSKNTRKYQKPCNNN